MKRFLFVMLLFATRCYASAEEEEDIVIKIRRIEEQEKSLLAESQSSINSQQRIGLLDELSSIALQSRIQYLDDLARKLLLKIQNRRNEATDRPLRRAQETLELLNRQEDDDL